MGSLQLSQTEFDFQKSNNDQYKFQNHPLIHLLCAKVHKVINVHGKILLFGEYGIIKDSKWLSIPYNSYKGSLKIKDFQ